MQPKEFAVAQTILQQILVVTAALAPTKNRCG